MDARLISDYLARAREILGNRSATEIEYDDTVVAVLANGMDIKNAVDAANREHPDEALKTRSDSLGGFSGTIRLPHRAQSDSQEIGNKGMNSHGSTTKGSQPAGEATVGAPGKEAQPDGMDVVH
jgi:hypothetical protein